MPSPGPMVSIIVAVYNAEGAIRKTLESARAQTYPYTEIIVIDGNSKDRTWDIVEEFSESIAFKKSESDRGIADAYNKGISAAKGEWLYFLNADDVFASNTVLQDIFESALIDERTEVLAGTVLATDGRRFIGRFDWRMLIRNQVHHQAIFYRSRLLRAHPYNAQYRNYGHDHEHNIFIWRRGDRVEYLTIVIAIWARGGISDTANWSQYREEFRVRRNAVGVFGWPFNVFSLLRFASKRLRAL